MQTNHVRTAIALAGVVVLIGFFVRALMTGEDIPTNFQIILAGIFGIALGAPEKLTKLVKGEPKADSKPEPKKEDEDV